jgi:mono/diheme cytochrome c family protein
MRWLCLGMMLAGCGADPAASGSDDSVDSADDTGSSGTDDSGSAPDTAAIAASVARGAAIVDSVCERCHGAYNPLAVRIDGLDDDEIAHVIQNGFGRMPPQDLDESEIADVIAYLRVTYPE